MALRAFCNLSLSMTLSVFAFEGVLLADSAPLPPQLETVFEQAIDAFEDRRYPEASIQLDQVIDQAPLVEEKAQAHVLKAVIAKNQNQPLAAATQYYYASDVYKKLSMHLHSARQFVNLANLYRDHLNQYQMALKHYKIAEKIFSDLGETSDLMSAQIDRGNTLIDLGQTDSALALLNHSMVFLDPINQPEHWLRGWLMIAKVYYRQGDFTRAAHHLSIIDKSLEKNPDLAASHPKFQAIKIDMANLKGLLEGENGRIPEAVAILKKVIREAEDSGFKMKLALLYNNLGYWQRESGQTEASRESHQKALSLDSAFSSGDSTGIAFDLRNIGLAWLKEGDTVRAAEHLQEAFALSSRVGIPFNSAHSSLGLGDISLSQENFAEAYAYYRSALDFATATQAKQIQWMAWAGMGHAAISQGHVELGVAHLRQGYRLANDLQQHFESHEARQAFGKQRRFDDLQLRLQQALLWQGKVEQLMGVTPGVPL